MTPLPLILGLDAAVRNRIDSWHRAHCPARHDPAPTRAALTTKRSIR